MSVNGTIANMRKMIQNEISTIHTSCLGAVVSYDPTTCRASVKPSLKYKAGDGRNIDYPIITNVPVEFPSSDGGNISLTFPLKQGDGVTLIFSERSLDDFLSSGESDDPRRYDLSDAIARAGIYKGGIAAAGKYPDDVCLTNGKATFRLTPSGEVIIEGTKLTMNMSEGSTITGGDLVVDGVSVKTHTHGGVQPGGANTNIPNT